MGGRYAETIAGKGITVELVWEDLQPPKVLELPSDQVGIGERTILLCWF